MGRGDRVSAVLFPQYGNDGKVQGIICMAQDITERKNVEEKIKASLEEKETLLYEVHHRVKNNLAVISSLLGIQARSINDERLEDVLKDSQNRVQSMSLIHETLYQSDNLSSINMYTYLSKIYRSLAQNYPNGSKINLKIESENILIGAKRATPIGLIVNELITNSLKYAFPEGQKGDIMISLEQTKNQFKLVYSDNGVGIPKDLGTCFIIKFKSNKEPIGLIS